MIGPASVALAGVTGAAVSTVVAPTDATTVTAAVTAVVIVAYLGVGLLILGHHPGHRVGLLAVVGGAAWGVGNGVLDTAAASLRSAPNATGASLAATLGAAGRGLGWLLLAMVLPLVFPDGRRAGSARVRRWAWRCAPTVVVSFTAAALLSPTLADTRLPFVRNPIGLPDSWLPLTNLLSLVGLLAAIATIVLAVTTLVQRWRGDDQLMRQRVLWFAIAFACPVVLFPLGIANDATPLMFGLASLPVPVAIGVAVLQHRLYDIQTVLNRSLTYGALWLLIAGVYAAIVGGVGAMLRQTGAPWLPWVAAGVVAVSFAPLRSALQQAANRLTYGQWSQPAAVLAATGRRLSDAADVPALLSTLSDELSTTLGLDYVEISDVRDRTLATSGVRPGNVEEIPLTAYGVGVGALRWGTTRLRSGDRALLADVAHQLGGVVHAASLLQVIREAQERLVLAHEEERKRLRRDLHDGLGPSLASLTLEVDTLRNRLGVTDVEAELLRIRSSIQSTVLDVRRIVEGLRPPALDELGLDGAIGQLASRLTHGTDLVVDIDVPALRGIPAAVEVAAYRVTQEALTNVVRHAHAKHAQVHVAVQPDGLSIEVRDDGVGTVSPRPGGVGLDSMRERAEEIGGRLRIDAVHPGGATVLAWLPMAGAS